MAKIMKSVFGVTLLMTICFYTLYQNTNDNIFLIFAITFGTTAYHFGVRLFVGTLFRRIMKNRADYTRRWYRVHNLEMKLYKRINVKKWKNKMPTYDRDTFDILKHSWDEIVQATCQSELVHEVNVVLSFLPLIASVLFGEFYVFLVTSILSALFDLMFVFMQRFNRARILKMQEKKRIDRFNEISNKNNKVKEMQSNDEEILL